VVRARALAARESASRGKASERVPQQSGRSDTSSGIPGKAIGIVPETVALTEARRRLSSAVQGPSSLRGAHAARAN
jgi:hypothetical protein